MAAFLAVRRVVLVTVGFVEGGVVGSGSGSGVEGASVAGAFFAGDRRVVLVTVGFVDGGVACSGSGAVAAGALSDCCLPDEALSDDGLG